jgi:AAA domain
MSDRHASDRHTATCSGWLLDDAGKPTTRCPHFAHTLLRRSELGKLPKVEPLIEDTISLRAAAVIVGATGIGKTVTGIGMACSVTTGTGWLGRRVTRVRGLYVVGEGAYGLDDKVDAWEKTWGVSVGDEDLVFSQKPRSLTDWYTWAELTETALDLGARFVMLDTFSSLAPDADEVKDAPRITRRLSDLSVAIDGTACLVHHPGWSDADRVRGGYQLEANVDEVLVLKGNPTEPLVTAHRKKVKDGPSGGTWFMLRRPRHGSVVMEMAGVRDVDAPARERILAVLAMYAGSEGPTGPQLCGELGVPEDNRSTVYNPLRQLVEDGRVVKDGPRGRVRYALPTQAAAQQLEIETTDD